jgi:DNA-directed RNA polymerase specialized sigma24 family protein
MDCGGQPVCFYSTRVIRPRDPLRLRKPNEKWLTDLADDSRRELVRFLSARLPNAFDAEDLVQEVFLRLMRIEDTSTIRDGRAFALRVAANVAH